MLAKRKAAAIVAPSISLAPLNDGIPAPTPSLPAVESVKPSFASAAPKTQTPSVHPLPAKPGTLSAAVKPSTPSNSLEKVEPAKPKKLIMPVTPRDAQLESFEAVSLLGSLSNHVANFLQGEAQIVMVGFAICARRVLAAVCGREGQPRENDVDVGAK